MSKTFAEILRDEGISEGQFKQIRENRQAIVGLLVSANRYRREAAGLPPDHEWEESLQQVARVIEFGALLSSDE